jgi:pimeloyl-ACP methyl ester carboxylesterase
MPTSTVTVKGLKLNVSIRGQGSPLLLLNGLGGLIRSFNPLRDELAEYQTITFDVPGVGKSQAPSWPMRLPRLADLIAELLKQLDLPRVDVFGVSWGGALAQEFALRHPRRVRQLILAATSAGPAIFMKPADVLAFFAKDQGAKRRRHSLAQLDEGARNSVQALLRYGVMNGMLSVNPRAYYHQIAALAGWTSLLRLFRLRHHTLILAGDRDPLVRLYNAHILRSAIRRAELRIMHGEGHFFVVTSAQETGQAIRGFLHHADEQEGPLPIVSQDVLAHNLLLPDLEKNR